MEQSPSARRVELALQLLEDSNGDIQRRIAIRTDTYLDAGQAKQLALDLLNLVDLMQPTRGPKLPRGFEDYQG